jgi:hypothetical protein
VPITGNKGEWSEVYVLFKLLADGKLFVAADENLSKNDDAYYEILKVFRKENVGDLIFAYDDEAEHVKIVLERNNELLILVPRKEFKDSASRLLYDILSMKSPAFSNRMTEEFLEKLHCSKLKAPASKKTDIKVQIYDVRANLNPVLGFSIKSRLGSPSTLLNASNTNITYRVSGAVTDYIKDSFNHLKRFQDRFDLLFNARCGVEYEKIDNEVFRNNLLLIDSRLPELTASLLVEYYAFGNRAVVDAIKSLKDKNPLKYDIAVHPFYEYKFQKLLSEVALGMTPSKPWTGKADATGGYIIVKEDGEIVCYHLYNRNEFDEYLLNNTCFETPSTSRHGFGKMYKENGEYFVKLNIQIRFMK